MYCPNCDQPLDSTEYESKISDHATEVIKTLLSLYVAGFGFYFTLAAVYFAFLSDFAPKTSAEASHFSSTSVEDIEILKFFMIALSVVFLFVTWGFRFAVEKTFLIYERNMLLVAGLQSDKLFSASISSIIRFGKLGALVVYACLVGAIGAIYVV